MINSFFTISAHTSTPSSTSKFPDLLNYGSAFCIRSNSGMSEEKSVLRKIGICFVSINDKDADTESGAVCTCSNRMEVHGGMMNMDNTCYLNLTLQALLHVPARADGLIPDREHS